MSNPGTSRSTIDLADGSVLLMASQHFASSTPEGAEPEPFHPTWEELPFIDKLLPRLSRAYTNLSYSIDLVKDPVRLEVMNKWDNAITYGFQIVHVISHGSTSLSDPTRSRSADDPEQLNFVPSCGHPGNGTDVVQWIRTAHRQPQPMLFIVDLCRAGRAARISHLTNVHAEDLHAWVIAATSQTDVAYDGRFSEAVADVLEQIADNGLDTDPSIEFVRWSRLVRAMQLRLEASGSSQRIHATMIDPSQPLPFLRFFRNPNWSPDVQREKLERINTSVRAFATDLGAEHFLDRVGDHFVGRHQQLSELAPWLDDMAIGGLRVVTGAPGSGKSALLGALACAGHCEIVAVVPEIRAYLAAQCPEGAPSPNNSLAAIHARGRDLETILRSLAEQWSITGATEPVTPSTIISAISKFDAIPALIFDALDEADNPIELTHELLLPFATRTRPDGSPICRLVIGTRRGPAAEPLITRAVATGDALVDLDVVPTNELRADLERHLLRALADMPPYKEPRQRPIRSALAAAVANTLTASSHTPREWGSFLVARIFSRSLVTLPPATDVQTAITLGASVPQSLPDVLELDLSLHADRPKLRAVLAAIAWAKGLGFPTDAILAVAPEFDSGVQESNVRALLNNARFYLRTSIDEDGATLYRLFHQGLSDYLKSKPWASEEAGRLK